MSKSEDISIANDVCELSFTCQRSKTFKFMSVGILLGYILLLTASTDMEKNRFSGHFSFNYFF